LNLATPYLKAGVKKDFVLHTRGVVKAMELIIQGELGDKDILIPVAILHDVGWLKVPVDLQKSKDDTNRKKALEFHLEYAPPIIEEVLTKVNYKQSHIQRVIEIFKAHKF